MRLPGLNLQLPAILALMLFALASYAASTADEPTTYTETVITEGAPEVSSSHIEVVEHSGWSSSVKDFLKDSKISDMPMSDLGGSLVLAVDKTAVSKTLKKYIMDAMKRLPVNSKGIKIGFVEYTDRPYTVVSLKEGASLEQVMAKLDQELQSKSSHSKTDVKVFDYVGLQAAYNELQKFSPSTKPRIVMLISSGKDADKKKSDELREKLAKEFISLSEVVVDSSSGSFGVIESGKTTSTDETIHESSFITSLLKSYSHSTIQYYKKLYGEVWEFYIMLKHYKKIYPTDWITHLKTWFSNKYGSSAKFESYLHRAKDESGTISPEEQKKKEFKDKYGSEWENHFLIWKYKKQFGSKWEEHYEQHTMKKKYGKNWFSEWEKLRFKKKYGGKWEPHYVKWYFKKYRGATWIYSWMKWQFRQKHKEGSKAYINNFMRWYYKYTKKGDKEFSKWKSTMKALSPNEIEKRFRWFYYNLVFQKKQALIKYNKWFYRKTLGKKYIVKYNQWLKQINKNTNWIKDFKKMQSKLSFNLKWNTKKSKTEKKSVIWFIKHYGRNWRWYYQRVIYRRRFGAKWRVHFNKWQKTVWKKPVPKRRRRIVWLHRASPRRWHYYVKRTAFRRRRVISPQANFYKKRYGSNWLWFFTRALYHRRYGSAWESHFNRWAARVWRRPAPTAGR